MNRKNETVLDPTAGSGSALLAAAEGGRHYIGFEREGEYESGFQRELGKLDAE
ncbi:DNA methyltransferase [Halodesulfurarchaeum formicicum]|uniref:DNA methyltransferase n=1 Tax=Halodesulfurarchaeum formicicum TaxID=1873524 RepID=UPI0009F7011C